MKLIALATAAALSATTAVAVASTHCASVDRVSGACGATAANARTRPVHFIGDSAAAASFDVGFAPNLRRAAPSGDVASLPCPWCVHAVTLPVGMPSARDPLFEPSLRHSLGLSSLDVPIADLDATEDGARNLEPKFASSEADSQAAFADPTPRTIAATTVMLVGLVLTRRRKSTLSLGVSPRRT
jgi:hypothetical protein